MKPKYRLICLFTALATVFSVASCGSAESEFYKAEYSTSAGALTLWAAYEHGDGEKTERFEEQKLVSFGSDAAQRFESVYCMLTSGTELSEINGEVNASLDLDAEFLSALGKAFELSSDTGGAYTPAHGAYLKLVKENAATEDAVAASLAHCGTDKFEIGETYVKKTDKDASVDLCTFAAGYALDEAMALLKENGVTHARLSFEGIEAVFGSKPDGKAYTIGIKDDGKTVGYFRITDGCVAEANTEDKGINYSASASNGDFKAVTVFSPSSYAAQALSNVIINMTEQEVNDLYKNANTEFEAVMIKNDGSVVKTERADTGLFIPETSETAKDE